MRAPRCARCRRLHLAALPCWLGRYAQRLVRLTLTTYGTVCHLCQRGGATSADHLLPRSRGGLDTLTNLRPAHARCNARRQDRDLTPALLASFRRRGHVEDGRGFFSPAGLETPLALSFPPHTPEKTPTETPGTSERESK